MPLPRTLLIIDPLAKQRAQLSYGLTKRGFHCEPAQALADYGTRLPEDAVILANAGGEAIPAIVDALVEAGHWLPVIAYGQMVPGDPAAAMHIVDTLRAGASDYLDWPIDLDLLESRLAVHAASDAGIDDIRHRGIQARQRLACLSQRERQILEGMASGGSSKAIARDFDISPRTVELHRANLLRKIEAASSAEAVRLATLAELAENLFEQPTATAPRSDAA